MFTGPVRTNLYQDFDMKLIFYRPPHKHFLQKTIIRGKDLNYSTMLDLCHISKLVEESVASVVK